MEVYLPDKRILKYQITACEQVPADSEIYQVEKGNTEEKEGNEIILSTCSAKANIRIVIKAELEGVKLSKYNLFTIIGKKEVE